MHARIVIAFVAGALAGCATVPSADLIEPANPASAVDRAMTRARDPHSVIQYAVGPAHQCNVGILGGRWCVCWQANGKNGFGGYTGVTRFVGWFDASGTTLAGQAEAQPMGLGAHCLSAPLESRDPAEIIKLL